MGSMGRGPTGGSRTTVGSSPQTEPPAARADAGRGRRGSRVWAFALVALMLLTLAIVVGLLDRSDPDLHIAYPRDREGSAAAAAADQAPPVVRPESEQATDDRPDQAQLRLPGALPPLADGTRSGREAMRRALAAPGHGHLLIDFATIGRSPLARKMMKCRGDRVDAALARMRDEFGIAVDRDLETIGTGTNVLAFGGRLGALKLPASAGTGVAYGDGARIYELGDDDGGRNHVAVLGDHSVLMADSKLELQQAVDRFEGRAPAETSRVAKADIEGQMLGDDLAEMLGAGGDPGAQPPPGSETPQLEVIRRLVRKVGMRVDVDERAAMSFDIDTDSGEDAEEIGAALRGGVAMLRQLARSEGLSELDALLDQARILDPKGGRVGLDLAVPGDWILARMGCDPDGTPRAPAPPPAASTDQGTTTLEIVPPKDATP